MGCEAKQAKKANLPVLLLVHTSESDHLLTCVLLQPTMIITILRGPSCKKVPSRHGDWPAADVAAILKITFYLVCAAVIRKTDAASYDDDLGVKM